MKQPGLVNMFQVPMERLEASVNLRMGIRREGFRLFWYLPTAPFLVHVAHSTLGLEATKSTWPREGGGDCNCLIV